jgi:hypothetical protein
MYSNKLNLKEFFFAVQKTEYVIIKMSKEFPNYYKRSDIDVFCNDVKEFSKCLLEVGNKYLFQNFIIEVKNNEENVHTYIDFYIDGDLDFRFDLYSAMPPLLNTIKMKPYYFYSVTDRRRSFLIDFNGEKYPIYIPSEIDELILRYLEYMEWYEKRPDKIKHLDYILDKISDTKIRKLFFDRLHIYAEFPPTEYKGYHMRSYIMSRYFNLPLFYFKNIKSKGLICSLMAIKNKIMG